MYLHKNSYPNDILMSIIYNRQMVKKQFLLKEKLTTRISLKQVLHHVIIGTTFGTTVLYEQSESQNTELFHLYEAIP